jgi:hypothetical protein
MTNYTIVGDEQPGSTEHKYFLRCRTALGRLRRFGGDPVFAFVDVVDRVVVKVTTTGKHKPQITFEDYSAPPESTAR